MRRPALPPLAVLVVLAACAPGGGAVDAGSGGPFEEDGGAQPADAGPVDSGYAPPREDLVEPFGEDGRLDVLTWNVENFPATASTPALVADIIHSLDVDLLGVQEIADQDAFEELVARLPEHEAVLSPDAYGDGTYQKVGFVYRSSLLRVDDQALLFVENGYEFPRPPLMVRFTYDDGVDPSFAFVAIALHLKAGRGDEDFARRQAAFELLEGQVRSLVEGGTEHVIVLGDFNETFQSGRPRDNWGPFLNAPDRYVVHTLPLYEQFEESFLPGGVILDHIVTTVGLDDEIAGDPARILHLEDEVPGYQDAVSDHVPVALSFGGT